MGSFISTIISYDLGYPNLKNTKSVIKGAGFKRLWKPRLLMDEPIIMDLPIALYFFCAVKKNTPIRFRYCSEEIISRGRKIAVTIAANAKWIGNNEKADIALLTNQREI